MIGVNRPGFLLILLFLLTLSPCVHLSFGFPSLSPSSNPSSIHFSKLDDSAKKTLPSQQILPPSMPMPMAITSSIKTNSNKYSSPERDEFPSQSESTSSLSPGFVGVDASPQNKFAKNFLPVEESIPIDIRRDALHQPQLSPTNVKRQIGNVIFLNLHEKETDEGEEDVNFKVGRQFRQRVTDVNPKSEFKTGSLSSQTEGKPSIHLTQVDVDVTKGKATVNPNHETDTDTDTLQLQLGNGNVNSFTGSGNNRRGNDIEKVGESFAIKNKVLGLGLGGLSEKRIFPEQRESRRPTQFSPKDNNKNERTETNRLQGLVVSDPISYFTPSTTKRPEKNSKIGGGEFLVSKITQQNTLASGGGIEVDVDTTIQDGDKDQITKKNRISQTGNGFGAGFGGDLYFSQKETGGEILPSCYIPVLVNQSTAGGKNSKTFEMPTDTETLARAPGASSSKTESSSSSSLKDMDKWTQNLVKMSQCVATCLERLSFGRKYNMSHGKRTNELGGGGGEGWKSGKSSFPMGIPALAPNTDGNYNGDGDINPNYFGDKVLSTCQKSCNFAPQMSSNSLISITRSWRKQTELPNKVNDPSLPPQDPTTSTSGFGFGIGNHIEMPIFESEEAVKNDKNSSPQEETESDSNAKKDTRTQFHLHWPKVISSAFSIKNKNPAVILYNVMVLSPQGQDKHPHLLPPRTWKLIDQTVAQQTQISLLATFSCGEKPVSQDSYPLITPRQNGDDDEKHTWSNDPVASIPIKVMGVGSNGLEKVFSGFLILVSNTTITELENDKSKSTLESECCQSWNWRNGVVQHSGALFNKNTEPQTSRGIRESNLERDTSHPTFTKENTNSDNVLFNPSSVSRNQASSQQNLVILRSNKNPNIASNRINFKRSWAPSPGVGMGTSYKVESDPSTFTRGKIDTDNDNEVKGNKKEDANRDEPHQHQQLVHEPTFSSKSQTVGKVKEAKITSNTANSYENDSDWGLRTLSMVYQNYLVVTEIGWKVPDGVLALVSELKSNSNQGEKNAVGSFYSGDKKRTKNNNNGDGTTGESANLVAPMESGAGESGKNMKSQKYQFLLTWEIFGGGLKGNLVTDMTSGSISLWPDTAYFIQVGLIDMDSGESEPSSDGTLSQSSSQEQEHHQNYMSNLLGLESIIFPLAPFPNGGGEPRVTFTSPRLFLNTSSISSRNKLKKKVSIPPKSSPGQSDQNNTRVVVPGEVITPRRNDSLRPKSNNPVLSPVVTKDGRKSTDREKYLYFTLLHKNKVKLDKKTGDKSKSGTGNVRPITIPGRTVSTNGNEGGGNGHLFPRVQQQGHPTRTRVGSEFRVSSLPSSSDEVGDHNSVTSGRMDTPEQKKDYEKNYNGGHDEDKSWDSHSKESKMMGDGPGGKVQIPSSSLLLQGNDEEFTEKVHGKLYHRSHSRHYLDTSISSLVSAKMNSTTNSSHSEDKVLNINEHKNNNPSSSNGGKKKASDGKSDHKDPHPHPGISGGGGRVSSSGSGSGSASAYRPEGYQGLFALNLGLGGYNYNYDHDEEENSDKVPAGGRNNGTNSSGESGASVIYSVFVLIVVACVIFLFLVAFIGFFIVTSSITSTAQFFIPKRLRVWVIGGRDEGELLAGNEESDNYGYGGEGRDRDLEEDGRFIGDDLDDDLVGEWGDDVDVGGGENGQQLSLSRTTSSILRGQMDMTRRDLGRT